MIKELAESLVAANPEEGKAGEFVPMDNKPKPQKKPFPKIADFCNQIADYAQGYKKAEKMRRMSKTVKARQYCMGNYVGLVNAQGIWEHRKSEGDGLYFDPQVATFVDILVSQIVKSKPKYLVKARAEHNINKREAAKAGQELLNHAQKDLLTASALQREVKWNLLLGGEAYRYTFFNKNKKGFVVEENEYDDKTIEASGKGVWVCPICTKNGELGEEGQETKCLDCGVKADVIESRSTNAKVFKGKNKKNIGDVDVMFPDPLEMTVISSGDDLASALVVMRERLIPRCVLESLFPDVEIPSAKVPVYMEYQTIANSQMDADMMNGSELFEMLPFQEVWAAPAVIHSYVFPQDEILANGTKVKAGSKAIEMFPTGPYFARVGTTSLNIYEQAITDCWVHCVNSISETFHGIGEWDLMELQDQKNEVRSMQLNSLFSDSVSPLLYLKQYLENSSFPNKPGARVPVKALPEGTTLQGVMARVPVGAGLPEAYALDDKLAGAMQQRAGAFSTQTDNPDIKAMGTATGLAMIQNNTITRREPMLQLRSEMEIAQGYQILALRQKYWCEEMYEGMAKDIGMDAIRWFRELDIDSDLVIEVVPDSWTPQTDAQKRMDFQEYLTIVLPLMGAVQDPNIIKGFIKKAAELYQGFDVESVHNDQVEAQIRLETLIQIAEYTENESGYPVMDETGMIIPDVVSVVLGQTSQEVKIVNLPSDPMPTSPLDVLLDNHSEFKDIYSEWLTSSEGRTKSQFIRTCVRTLIDLHREAAVYQTQAINTDMNLGEQPNIEAQMLAAQAQHKQQMMQGEDVAQAELDQQGNAQAQQFLMEQAATQAMPEDDSDDRAVENDAQKTAVTLMDKQADRDHQVKLKQMDIDAKKAETSKSKTQPKKADKK